MKKPLNRVFSVLILIFAVALSACSTKTAETPSAAKLTPLTPGPNEKHFASLSQLTFGGDNAEAYWSFDGKSITFQSNNPAWGLECDQIFSAPISAFTDSSFKPELISTGAGRTTCSYFMPDGKHVLFASTHAANKSCPVVPDHSKGYVWPIYNTYDIYVSDLKGNIEQQLTHEDGYDAEGTISPDGKSIVFTSTRSGDLELWIMDIDGKNPRQITKDLGYDGGAFFSPDSKKLIYRASRPKTDEEVAHYKALYEQGLVEPTQMELFTINVDGSNQQQITHLGKANWAPFYHPSGKKIIFSSNHASKKGYDFQLYMVNEDGSGLEQITTESVFNAFPMFSPDGTKLIFSSNRNNGGTHATNLFIAEWKD